MNYFSYVALKVRKNCLKIFLIIGFIISWGSLSTSANDITIIFSTNKISLILLINFLRSIAVIVYFIGILFCLILFFKKIDFNFKDSIFHLLFFFYFLLQIPGLFLTENSLNNIYYIISSLNIILIFFFSLSLFDKNEMKLFMYISFSFLLIIFSIYFLKDLYLFLFSSGSFYSNFNNQVSILDTINPRSTGMSRTAILLLLSSAIIFYKLKLQYIRYIIIIFLSTAVFMYQSRTSIGLIFGVTILEIFFLQSYNFKSILKKIMLFIIIPFIIFSSVTLIKATFLLNAKLIKLEKLTNSKPFKEMSIKEKLQQSNEVNAVRHKMVRQYYNNFSSSRFSDWQKIINFFLNYKNTSFLLFGNGAQGDRFSIDQTASNGLMYALISSGIIGSIFLVTSLIILSIKILSFVFINKIWLLQNSIYNYIILILVLLARSILETSYAVFGIDFIILFTCITMLQKEIKDK